MESNQKIILVDANDIAIGTMDKMEVHERGLLHRAFSVFIFNKKGEMLLQQRAFNKYHSGGLWTNACCSHPFPNEDTLAAAERRLSEELGFTTTLKKAFDFLYKASFDNGLTEHEFDHVFVGNYDGAIHPDAKEVANYCYKSVNEIKNDLQTHPQHFTVWFHIAFEKLLEWNMKK